MLALAAGVLAQAAQMSLREALHGLRPSRLLFSHPAAVTAMAAILTVLAVHTALSGAGRRQRITLTG